MKIDAFEGLFLPIIIAIGKLGRGEGVLEFLLRRKGPTKIRPPLPIFVTKYIRLTVVLLPLVYCYYYIVGVANRYY